MSHFMDISVFIIIIRHAQPTVYFRHHIDICFIPRADGHGGIYLGNGLGPVTAESPRHLAALAESR